MKKQVSCFPTRFKAFILFTAVFFLFSSGGCTRIARLVESADPYHTKAYKAACDAWSREARIHRGLEVKLIVSATFKSEEFRRAFAKEYAKAYKLTPDEEKRFIEDQLKAASHSHEFLMASFVPEKKWDDFDKTESMWKLYLVTDQNDRVIPVEVRKIKRQNAVTPHFFPYITPWKSTYIVRFPYNIPETNQPVIKDSTRGIKLVITSVLGIAEMDWELK
ncbi:MAG: hypothetical protein JRJ42_05845 [Deltaproteobacteria bacterium]|nr:hypothetical protein [Deltaproteobacteria bacterium]MBW2020460.1 hypothetical protein [Deltaproteobacteria bacterium]MBW2074477.1 hypothetical protein [Deltaproteobacteria bacterium]RLB80998.1 MAG: hypothetical protein DRH17_10480 [Deltaproteobacteria bacterium]